MPFGERAQSPSCTPAFRGPPSLSRGSLHAIEPGTRPSVSDRAQAVSVLTMNTVAFTVCFAVWMLYGVLITFLVDNHVFAFDKAEMGWLIGIPVLSGSLLRLPAGVLTDK